MPWWLSLDDVRQRIVSNMAFNMGVSGLLTFKNTLSAMRRGCYSVAAAGMKNSKWAVQVGDRAKRLYRGMESGTLPLI